MTRNLEQTTRTGVCTAWNEASASLVKAEDILRPEELAAKLKVPDSWVYEKTRGPASLFQVALRVLRGAQPGRFPACGWGATCDSIGLPSQHNMADLPHTPGKPSGKAEPSGQPEGPTPGLTKTGLNQAGGAPATHGCD